MRIRRNIYFTVSLILIALNLIYDLSLVLEPGNNSEGFAYNVGYFLGSNSFLIVGLILLRMGYKLNRKIAIQKELLETDAAIASIGQKA